MFFLLVAVKILINKDIKQAPLPMATLLPHANTVSSGTMQKNTVTDFCFDVVAGYTWQNKRPFLEQSLWILLPPDRL